MNKLLKISEFEGKQVVNARKLHQFLGSKQDFSNWIKNRIEKWEFIEDKDYVIVRYNYLGIRLDKNIASDNQQVAKKEYGLTVNMAKQISMVENNEKGRQARLYFIEAEEQRNKMLKTPDQMNRLELLKLAVEQEEQKLALEAKIDEDRPKVEYHDRVISSNGTFNVTVMAKTFGMSAKALNAYMEERRIQFRTNKKRWYNKKTGKFQESFTWVPYAKYQDQGYCKVDIREIELSDGAKRPVKNTVWFEKGQQFIYDLLKKDGLIDDNYEQNKLNF